MAIALPPLPYDRSALEPHLSTDTVDLQHGKLQQAHVDRVNALVARTALAEAPLDAIVRSAQGDLFQHAAQVWNDDFYWRGLKPAAGGGGGDPDGRLAEAIAKNFGDVARLRQQFGDVALRAFGAGWVWLLQRPDGALAIAFTANAATPLTGESTPLLACCGWEHAWLLDYRHARDKYLAAFWQLVDWKTVASRMK